MTRVGYETEVQATVVFVAWHDIRTEFFREGGFDLFTVLPDQSVYEVASALPTET